MKKALLISLCLLARWPSSLLHPTLLYAVLALEVRQKKQKQKKKRKVRSCSTLPNRFGMYALYFLSLSHTMSSMPEEGYERRVKADTIHSRMGIISGIYLVT